MIGSRNRGMSDGPPEPLNDDDHRREHGRRRRLRRSHLRELAGIVSVIVILFLVSVVLIVVFQGQSRASLASPASPATPTTAAVHVTFPVGSASAASSIPAEIQQAPSVVQLYKAGLGLSLNKSATAGGVTITLQWIYADAHQVWAAYTFTGLQTNAGLQAGTGDSAKLAGLLDAQRICGFDSISASVDNVPAKRLTSGAQGGPIAGNIQGCLASEDVYFSDDNLGAVVPVTVTVHGESMPPQSSSFSLSATVLMVPNRAVAVHQSVTVGGKTLMLDGVSVTPTGPRVFFAGDATKLESFPASRFTINGQPVGITTIVGSSTRWSSAGDQVYDLNYDDPGWEKPWTIKVMLITKLVPVPAYQGTPTVDLSPPATFTFTLPPASWDTSIAAAPTP